MNRLARLLLHGAAPVVGGGYTGLRWSTALAPILGAGDPVLINTPLMIDVASSPSLGTIHVASGGYLFPDPTMDVGLTFADAMIDVGGAWNMHGATLADPYTHTATFAGNGARSTHTARASSQGFTNDGLARAINNHGTRIWRGVPKSLPKTKLNATAALGATSITVEGNCTDWVIGEDIAIAPTNFYGQSVSERRTITSVGSFTGGNTVIGFTTPLVEKHWGLMQYPIDAPYGTQSMSLTPGTFTPAHANTPTFYDVRAEVINLSNGNIVVQAPNDTAWSTQGWGVHMMDHPGSTYGDTGVRIIRGGQRGALARYPFHEHRLSYVDATHAVTIANPGVVTWAGHGLPDGQPIMFSTTGALPTGLAVGSITLATALVSGSIFYIVNGTTNTFQVSATRGGAAITTSGSQSGVHTALVTLFTQDRTDCYRRKCTVDTSENRAFTRHASCGTERSDCIAYDVKGMAFFDEDGSELRGLDQRNFALKVRDPVAADCLKFFDGKVPDDTFSHSSGHWFSNPDSTRIDCTAADVQGWGVWNSFGNACFGISALVNLDPSTTTLGTWIGNGGHTTGKRPLQTLNGVTDEFGNFGANWAPPVQVAMRKGIGWKGNQGTYLNQVNGVGPLYESWTVGDSISGDFEGVATGNGLSHWHLFVAQSLNDVGTAPVVSDLSGGTNNPRFGFATYHYTLIFKDCTFQNYQWVDGVYTQGGQKDYGGGCFTNRDLYTISVAPNNRYSSGHKLNNSSFGFFSRPPRYSGYPVTLTLANPCVLTATNFYVQNGAPFVFTRTRGTLPSAVAVQTVYFIKNVKVSGTPTAAEVGIDASVTFELALTSGGTSISTASQSQTSTHDGMCLWRGGETLNFDLCNTLPDPYLYYGAGSTGATPRTIIHPEPFWSYGAANTISAEPSPGLALSTTDGYVGFADFYGNTAPNDGYPTDYGLHIDRLQSLSNETVVGTYELGPANDAASGRASFFYGFQHVSLKDGGRFKVTHPAYAVPTTHYYARLADSQRAGCTLLLELPWSGSVAPTTVRRQHSNGAGFPPSPDTDYTSSSGGVFKAVLCTAATGIDRAAKIAAVAASDGSLYYQDTSANSIFVKHMPLYRTPADVAFATSFPETNQEKAEDSNYIVILA